MFEYYPGLGGSLPWVSLTKLPTPITRRGWPGQPGQRFWIKRDDLSSPLYGGNKIRKLEFLLGRALAEDRKAVMTFGVAGSNHVLATARCSRKLGLDCIAILSRQPATSYLAANLAAVARSGARTCNYPDISDQATAFSAHEQVAVGQNFHDLHGDPICELLLYAVLRVSIKGPC